MLRSSLSRVWPRASLPAFRGQYYGAIQTRTEATQATEATEAKRKRPDPVYDDRGVRYKNAKERYLHDKNELVWRYRKDRHSRFAMERKKLGERVFQDKKREWEDRAIVRDIQAEQLKAYHDQKDAQQRHTDALRASRMAVQAQQKHERTWTCSFAHVFVLVCVCMR